MQQGVARNAASEKREGFAIFLFYRQRKPLILLNLSAFHFAQKGAKEERESFAVSFLLLLHCSSVAFMDFLTVQAIRKTWTCLPFFFIFLLLMRVVSVFFRCCFSAFYCFMDLRLWFVVDKLVVDKWRVKRWCCWGYGYLR